MPWSEKATLTGLGAALSETTNVDGDFVAANHFSQWDTLSPGESAHIQVQAVFGSTGSDMLFRVVGTLDASAENADTIALAGGSVGFVASTTQRKSIVISGPYKYRVEVRKGGTTSGSYTPNVFVRKNGVSV